MPARPTVALDDDPTGAQSLHDVRVLLGQRGSGDAHGASLDGITFMLTNTRAMDAEVARATVSEAARYGLQLDREARFLLRSDSTLRGHLLAEYEGLCHVVHAGQTPPILLVPALPAAGRITVDGVHFIERDGRREALSQTEYAQDPRFGYRTSRLLDWAEERSAGFFRAVDGQGVPLSELRSDGPALVTRRLRELAVAGVPAALVPDAVTADDLDIIARGLAVADELGLETVVRCGPAFVAALGGHAATGHVPPPQSKTGLLVVCGSWVPTSTRQLEHLEDRLPDVSTRIDLEALRRGAAVDERERAVQEVRRHLEGAGVAILSTPRRHAAWAVDGDAARLVRGTLVAIVAAVAPRIDVLVTKGGITSADVAVEALAEPEAYVVGPVEDGVMHWRFGEAAAPRRHQLVVPGNVGDDGLLTRLAGNVMARRDPAAATRPVRETS